MIHNLKHNQHGIAEEGTITFTVITEVGQCEVRVDLDDYAEMGSDQVNRPKAYVTDYKILGKNYTSILHHDDSIMLSGVHRLAESVRTICENNNWCLWSY